MLDSRVRAIVGLAHLIVGKRAEHTANSARSCVLDIIMHVADSKARLVTVSDAVEEASTADNRNVVRGVPCASNVSIDPIEDSQVVIPGRFGIETDDSLISSLCTVCTRGI